MPFDSADPRITAYVFDELGPEDKREFEARLEQSPGLRQIVKQTLATIESLQAGFDHSEPLRLSDERRAAVTSAVWSDAANERPSPAKMLSTKTRAASFHARVWSRIAVAGGVAAVLLISAFVLFKPGLDRVRTTAQYATPANDVLAVEKNTTAEWIRHPFPDEPPLTYPDAEQWEELSQRRRMDAPVLSSNTKIVDASEPVPDADFDALVDLITTEVAPETWNDVEPTAEYPTNLSLAVSQSQEINNPDGEPLDERPDHGAGPGEGGDKHDVIVENPFLRVTDAPLSTFSIDVDTASYSKMRMYLNEHRQLPRPDAVRIEELINYFPYNYGPPSNEEERPFSAHQAVASCPWSPNHRLVRIGIKGKEIRQEERPASNLVFLLDVSGSMDEPNKLPLLKRGMRMLTDQLSENDRVAIVVYAGAAGKVLDSTTGDHKAAIVEALDRLKAGGSTNGGAGIQLAYQTALDHFIAGGTNRVILCTDGDFNVGTTGTDELVRTIEQHAKSGVFLTVLGFGMGNHNDSMLEQISNKGNGNYAFVDTDLEARKVLVEQMSATLVTIAKDVKIQVEFNPAKVAAYRLIGYENRVLAAQDFNDDTKDAGEIGAGHTVTALYELIPAGESVDVAPATDELKYQTPPQPTEAANNSELLTLKLRFKEPAGDTSTLLTFPLADSEQTFNHADRDFQFAASVASFGMLLRDSKYKGNATYTSVLEIATAAAQDDRGGYRAEFLQLVRTAAELAGESLAEADE